MEGAELLLAALDTGRPRCFKRDKLWCGHAGSVHSLTAQHDSLGQARYGAGLKIKV